MEIHGDSIVHEYAVGPYSVVIRLVERICSKVEPYLYLGVGIHGVVSSLYGQMISDQDEGRLVRIVCDSEMAVERDSSGVVFRIEVLVVQHTVSLEVHVVLVYLAVARLEH